MKKKKKKGRKEAGMSVSQGHNPKNIGRGGKQKDTEWGFFQEQPYSNKNFFTINNPSLCLSVCLSVCLSNYPTILDVLVVKHV
jgi:hypothetical protein